MQTQRYNLNKSILNLVLVIVLSLFVPMSAYADATNPDTTTTGADTQTVQPQTVASGTEQSPTTGSQGATSTGAGTNGVTGPTGSASNTFSRNEQTGLWENEHYYWDPATKQTKPKTTQTYSYNPSNGKWDTNDWLYDPASGKYVPNTYAVTQPPVGAPITPQQSSTPTHEGNSQPGHDTNGSIYNGFFNAAISNTNTTQATSGNAIIGGNTYAGSAKTGNATAIANLFNLLQSSTNFLGNGTLSTFNADIQGDVVGDLLINPGAIGQLSAAGAPTSNGNLTVTNQSSGSINNNLAVSANSGNATISNNTEAGNATTGDANAVANVINMLNSAISTGQSFLGNINIHGSLDGDILLPAGFLDSLIASNASVPSTTGQTENCGEVCGNATNITTENNSAITNNIGSNAATGNAIIANNSEAGNSTTGNATSNVTLLNLTGHEIVGKNSLLVFVNVLGKWYGMIMDAPAGATAASVGGGLSQNKLANSDINSTNDSSINNNIDVNAVSGDATIANNTLAGDATTGNATTSVNLANFINSSMALSDWFGILFINVFGTWNGSFGKDTTAGTHVVEAPSAGGPQSSGNNVRKNVFSYMPKTASSTATPSVSSDSDINSSTVSEDSNDEQNDTQVLGASEPTTPIDQTPSTQTAASTAPSWMMPIIGSLVAAFLLGAEQAISRRTKRHARMQVVPQAGHITTA